MKEKNKFTLEKIDELLSLLVGYETQKYTFENKGYDFIDVGQLFVKVKNPEKTNDLSIKTSDVFTLFFAGTQKEFPANEQGFNELKILVQAILDCSQCVYVLNTTDGSRYAIGKVLSVKEINDKTIKNIINSFAEFRKMKMKNAKLRLIAWQSEYNKEFCL